MGNNETGKTKDAGFEFGVRKTFPVPLDLAWSYIFSNDGIKAWLGELSSIDSENFQNFQIGKSYKTKDGIEGIIKVFKPLSHIRLTWKKKGWNNASTLQVRLMNAKSGTTISFHQEFLLDNKQRVEMKIYWDKVLEEISKSLI